MARWDGRLVGGLIVVEALNAAFDAVALYPIAEGTSWGEWAKRWGRADLDRLEFPPSARFVFPPIKGSAALGLFIGWRYRRLGQLTASALVMYFGLGIVFHLRANDDAGRFGPAVAMFL